jgi:NAD(P)-dependent dehydrogenase (short-subunit alcohol dehydrogenase family)
VLINNAGVLESRARIHEVDVAEYWRMWEVHVKGTFLPTRAALRTALGRPARPVDLTIINTSSTGAVMTMARMSAYQGAKSAINRFTEFVHFEYEAEGVRAFAYHPGAPGAARPARRRC